MNIDNSEHILANTTIQYRARLEVFPDQVGFSSIEPSGGCSLGSQASTNDVIGAIALDIT
jgi:hypothetical protein